MTRGEIMYLYVLYCTRIHEVYILSTTGLSVVDVN
jgi:hypothetical protein